MILVYNDYENMIGKKRLLLIYFCFILFFIPTLTIDIGGGKLGVSDVMPIIILCALFIFGGEIKNSFHYVWPSLFIGLAFVSTTLNVLIGNAEANSLINLFRLVFIFSTIIMASISALSLKEYNNELISSLLFGLLVTCLFGVAIDFLGIEVREQQQRMWLGDGQGSLLRAGGILGNTASFGHHIAMLYAFGLFTIFKAYNIHLKILCIFIFIVVFYCLIISSSRAALLNIVIFSLVFLFLTKGIKSFLYMLVFGIIFFVVVYISFIYILDDSILDYSLSRLGIGSVDLGTLSSSRLDNWAAYTQIIKDNFLFGLGYKAALETYGLQVDNSFMSVLLEFGILAFLSFLLMWASLLVGSLLKYANHKSLDNCFLVAFVLANLAHSLTLDIYTLWISFPLFLFVVYYFISKGKNDENINSSC